MPDDAFCHFQTRRRLRLAPSCFCVFGVIVLAIALGGCRNVSFTPLLDSGGNLRGYVAEVQRLNAKGSSKAIRGVCASACTIYLGVKNVCVEPTAQLWFHAAHLPNDSHPDPLGSLEMLSYYPPSIRDWAIRTGALENTGFDEAKKLTGEQLVLMGVAPCVRGWGAAPNPEAAGMKRASLTTETRGEQPIFHFAPSRRPTRELWRKLGDDGVRQAA